MAKRVKRSATMVMIHLPERPLAYADAIFRIRMKGEKLGEVRISQGGMDWYPPYAKQRRRFSWAKLAKILDDA